MRVLIILLMAFSLYAETFREYKIEVMDDMNTFQKAMKPFDKEEIVGKTILSFMEYLFVAPSTVEADIVTLYYLDYKQKTLNKLLVQLKKQQRKLDYGKNENN